MSTEIMSMLGGGLAGFIFRFMAASIENQQKTTEMLLQKQAVADDSADRAAVRRRRRRGRSTPVPDISMLLGPAPKPALKAAGDRQGALLDSVDPTCP